MPSEDVHAFRVTLDVCHLYIITPGVSTYSAFHKYVFIHITAYPTKLNFTIPFNQVCVTIVYSHMHLVAEVHTSLLISSHHPRVTHAACHQYTISSGRIHTCNESLVHFHSFRPCTSTLVTRHNYLPNQFRVKIV